MCMTGPCITHSPFQLFQCSTGCGASDVSGHRPATATVCIHQGPVMNRAVAIADMSFTQATSSHAWANVAALLPFLCLKTCPKWRSGHRTTWCTSTLSQILLHTRKLQSQCVRSVSQGLSREDQRTQNQMVHMDTEYKLLEVWLLHIARMASILTGAQGTFGDLQAPVAADMPKPPQPDAVAKSAAAKQWAGFPRLQGESLPAYGHMPHMPQPAALAKSAAAEAWAGLGRLQGERLCSSGLTPGSLLPCTGCAATVQVLKDVL